MITFLKLTQNYDGSPRKILMNSAHIVSVLPSELGGSVLLTNFIDDDGTSGLFHVEESLDQINRMLCMRGVK